MVWGKKRSSSNPPRPSTTSTSAAATTAASQAFLAHKASHANISNAAAAAALRSYATTPTPVSQVQTKRMQRRGSNGSQASAPGSIPTRPGLQRRDSSGSMTERTFRSPSPNRPASSHGPYPRYDHEEAPPVPALPKNITQTPSIRSASVDPQLRVSSPQPRQAGGRGVSLDRGAGVLPSPKQKVPKKSKPEKEESPESPGVRNSINFSRPMSPLSLRPQSPLALAASNTATKSPAQTPISKEEARNISKTLSETAERPVKKKKKSPAKSPAEGSHLASGTSGGPPQGTALAPVSPPQVSSADSTIGQGDIVVTPTKPQKKKKKKVDASLQPPSTPGSDIQSVTYASDTDSVASEQSSTVGTRSPNTRASGILAKQPSIVREDREGEEEAEGESTESKNDKTNIANGAANGAAPRGNPANTSKVVSKDRQHNRSVSQSGLQKSPDAISNDRPVSLTPSRSTHFSSQPEYANLAAIKHQPPARSISPAKSALKHSPSRGHSPVVNRSGLAPSEASDTASQVSDDGLRSTQKKKKSVRVSFDEESVLIGHAAGPPSATDSPVVLSPQGKAKSQSWLDHLREKTQDGGNSDQDEDGVIKPTPALPSFGSVRGRGQKGSKDADVKPAIREEHTKGPAQSLNSSTDAAIGGVIIDDVKRKNTSRQRKEVVEDSSNDPIPPEVTSVEGSGDHSDEESDSNVPRGIEKDHADDLLAKSVNEANSKIKEAPGPVSAAEDEGGSRVLVPTIAIEPASPQPDSVLNKRQSWLGMPGGFPSSNENEEKKEPSSGAQAGQVSPEISPATTGISEPEPEAAAQQHDPDSPTVGEIAKGLRTQIGAEGGEETEKSEESDESSIYSDAAEDQSDPEGDGFGSINAIVESPASPSISLQGKSPPASPSIKPPRDGSPRSRVSAEKADDRPKKEPGESWDQAQSYWSALSETQRQQLERAAMPGAADEPVLRNRTMRGVDAIPKKKKKTKKSDQQVERTRLAGAVPASPPGVKKPLAVAPNTSQQQQAPTGTMRSSMRTPPPASETKPPIPKKKRPASASVPINPKSPSGPSAISAPSARPASTIVPASSTPAAKAPKKKPPEAAKRLQRADSDSSSSFKRARARTPDNHKYKMKRSMRGSSNEMPMPAPGANRASSLSLRSSSPAESFTRRPFSTMGASGMRSSMRESTDMSKPARMSLRAPKESGKPSRTKSPSRFGFGKGKSTAAESKPASRFASRFGDSSDEEDGLPIATRSRFADSSDEEPSDLAPVRGIPRRIDEGDSTDLEDSSGDENSRTKTQTPATSNTQDVATTSPEGAALASGSLRTTSGNNALNAGMGSGLQAKKAAEKEKKKRSFFAGFGSKKRSETPKRGEDYGGSSPLPTVTATLPSPSQPMNKAAPPPEIVTNVAAQSPKIITTNIAPSSLTNSNQPSPKSPKLQRRHTPKKILSTKDISWPLAQNAENTTSEAEMRPRTSDGGPPIGNSERPSLGLRQSTVQSEADARPLAMGVGLKKKKVPFWKKAFGRSS